MDLADTVSDRARLPRPHLLLVAGAALCVLASRAMAQDSWTAGADMPTPRRLLAAAGEGGRIYTFGGCGSPCFDPISHPSTFEERRLEVYDGDTWSVRRVIPAILFGAAAAAPGNGQIYLFGGFVTPSSTYAYDPSTDTWQGRRPVPSPRHGLAAVALGGKVYVLGGSDGQRASSALEVYDPASNTWTQEPPMPTARVFLAAAAVNGKIYAIGGSPDCCGNGRTDAVEVFDPEQHTWSQARSLPVALQVSAAAVANDRIYVFGGFIPGAGIQRSTFEYNPAANEWTSRNPMPVGRDQAPAVASGGEIFVLGGAVSCHCRALANTSRYRPPDGENPGEEIEADLRITKQSEPGEVFAGERVLYTITAENLGPDAVTGATVKDTLPGALTGVIWKCERGACTTSATGEGQVDLQVGGSAVFTLSGILDPEASASLSVLSNTVRIQSPAKVADPDLGNNSDTEIDHIGVCEDVSITLDDFRATVAPAGMPIYDIALHNRCAAPVSVTVTDDLTTTGLEGVKWCRGSGCLPSTSGNLIDTLTIPAGATVIYRATGTVPCACGVTRIVNTACLAPTGECTPPDVDRIEPAAAANLSVEATGPDALAPGATGAYSFTVTNGGPCPAPEVVLQIEPPAGFETASIAPPCEPGLPCRVRLGALGPGAHAGTVASLRAPFVCGAVGTTSASVSSSCTDPVPGNNTDTLDTRVLYDVSISKTDHLETAAPGEWIAYLIEVENKCSVAVAGARVADLFPPELEEVQWCPVEGCVARTGDLTATVDLPANEARYFYVSARISAAFSGSLSNTATVDLPEDLRPDAVPQDNSAKDETLVAPAPGGTAFCLEMAGTPVEGATMIYTFVLWNGGPEAQGDNPGDEFIDALPAGLTLTGADADSGTATTAAGTVRWNGAIPIGGRVVIHVKATIDAGTLGTEICNQGELFFDANGDGVNESSVLTDDPGTPGGPDPCCFEVLPPLVEVIPTLSGTGLAMTVLLLALLALARLRRRTG